MSVTLEPFSSLDVDDLIARGGYGPHEIASAKFQFTYYLRNSTDCWVGKYNGEIALVVGLMPPSLLSEEAYMWMLNTEVVQHHEFLLIRHSQMFIKDMLERYKTITGFCNTSHTKSIRWLKWLGAEFASEPVKGNCLPFKIRRK